MSKITALRDLFDRWEKVWHEGRLDLVPECVSFLYVIHDEVGYRPVILNDYVAEIAKIQEHWPGIRVVVYDHSFEGNMAWFRFAFKWSNPKTGESLSRAGMQAYRIESGKLNETWISMQPLGSTWTGIPQAHWTSE